MKGLAVHDYLIRGLKAFLFSFVLFIILFTLLAVLLVFTSLPEQGMVYYILAICGVVSFFMGLQSGIVFKKRGLIFGALFAGILLLILLMVSYLCSGMENSILIFRPRYLPCLFLGSLGGMFGVNLKI